MHTFILCHIHTLSKGKGKNILAMDALFGLPRKKSAGISYRDPLHGELFFCSQPEVDQFVADSGKTKSKYHSKVCRTFKYRRHRSLSILHF